MSKNAIVTGSAGNMGTAVVKKLLEENFRVTGCVLSGESSGDNENHPNFDQYEADVTDPEQCVALVKHAKQTYGDIDLAALLVGGFGMSSFEKTRLEDLHKMFKLNFESAFLSAQAVFHEMKKQKAGGKIILVGAKPALEKGASAGLTAYALSKSLIFKLAEHINAEGAEADIKASVIVPSILDTPPNRDAMPDADFQKWVTPEEIAKVVAFIASEASSALRDPIYRIYADS